MSNLIKVNANSNIKNNPRDNDPLSFFPDCDAVYQGNTYHKGNPKLGTFVGTIEDIRPIESKTNPHVFAVIDIVVKGERKPFQDYLNFNKGKAIESLGYLVSHVEDLIASAGYADDTADEEKDMDWVKKKLAEIKALNPEFTFTQSRSTNGLDIEF